MFQPYSFYKLYLYIVQYLQTWKLYTWTSPSPTIDWSLLLNPVKSELLWDCCNKVSGCSFWQLSGSGYRVYTVVFTGFSFENVPEVLKHNTHNTLWSTHLSMWSSTFLLLYWVSELQGGKQNSAYFTAQILPKIFSSGQLFLSTFVPVTYIKYCGQAAKEN